MYRSRPRINPEKAQALNSELLDVLRRGHAEGMEMAGWIAEALSRLAENLPGKTEEVLQVRSGSWEADLVRKLINATIGWPGVGR